MTCEEEITACVHHQKKTLEDCKSDGYSMSWLEKEGWLDSANFP